MFDYETKHLSISMKDTNIQLASRNLFLKLNTILFVLNKQLPEIGMKNTNDAMVGTFVNETSHLTLQKKINRYTQYQNRRIELWTMQWVGSDVVDTDSSADFLVGQSPCKLHINIGDRDHKRQIYTPRYPANVGNLVSIASRKIVVSLAKHLIND